MSIAPEDDTPPFEYEDIPGYEPFQEDHEMVHEILSQLDETDMGGQEEEGEE